MTDILHELRHGPALCDSSCYYEIMERAAAEIERLRAECDRVKELFALKWDATQSTESDALRAEIERLKEINANLEHLKQSYLDEIQGLRVALKDICEADRDDLNDSTSDVWQRACAAIAKATGP